MKKHKDKWLVRVKAYLKTGSVLAPVWIVSHHTGWYIEDTMQKVHPVNFPGYHAYELCKTDGRPCTCES